MKSILKSIITDPYFRRYKEKSIKWGCGYYIESDPQFFDSYSLFKRKIDLLTDRLKTRLEKDEDLIGVKIFADVDEFVLLNELFLFNKTFQPKTVDDLRILRNPTSLCVLKQLNWVRKWETFK